MLNIYIYIDIFTLLLMETILCKEGYLIKKTSITPDKLTKIKKKLTVKPYNPVIYGKNQEDKSFEVFQENDEYLNIPKFYGLKKYGNPTKNLEINGDSININFNGSLRDYQQEIIDIVDKKILESNGGLLSVGCGKGKTVMGIYLACKYKVKTLVIVHKTFLLNQWKERIEQFSNARIGIIQQNKIDIEDKDIVIGMLQSIAKDKYDQEIFRDFGFTIFDEAHHAPSEFFSKALPIISSKKSLALSATPKRSDKLEKIIFWYMGEIAYESPPNENKEVLVKIYNFSCDNTKFKIAKLPYNGDINRPKTINRLIEIEDRNKLIIKLTHELTLEVGRKILLLSDRIDHLNYLKEEFDKLNLSSDFYIGGRKQKDLTKAEDATIILGSYGMASEALDIPSLNTLIMATPRSKVEQAVGRIIRKKSNIQPIIVDITDNLQFITKQGFIRKKLYDKLKYKKIYFDVNNTEITELLYNDIEDNNDTDEVQFLDI